MDADQIIIEPIVTEKTNIMRESHKYTFKVNRGANKYQVMQAVNDLFNVHPLKCNIVNVSRKPKRVRYRLGYTAVWKKAVVTLPPGEIIPIFEGA